jgi:pyrroloquinoline quinone biosynthesis protein B
VDHNSRQSWLIDATPDLKDQVHALAGLAPDCSFSGIILTHAHMGHYIGLAHLGLEAWNAKELPVYASRRMADFLRKNAPWSKLVSARNISLQVLEPGLERQLGPGLDLTPIEVPHRGEFSDTMAFVVRGAARKLFYCPDIDSWDGWDQDLRTFLSGCDIALLDGTFYSPDELPWRDLSLIPHHMAQDTARRLAGVDCEVRLIHLNHTNPLHAPGPEMDWLARHGTGVGALFDQWSLS